MWKARKLNLWEYLQEHSQNEDCKNELAQQLECIRDHRTMRIKRLDEDEKLHILSLINTYDIKYLPDNFFKVAQSISILNNKSDGAVLSRLKEKDVIHIDYAGKQRNEYLDENFDKKMTTAYKEFNQVFDKYWPWQYEAAEDANLNDKVKQLKLWSEQEPAKYLQAWQAKFF